MKKNYRKTAGSLWNYYKDEPNSGVGGANNNIQSILIIKQVLH